jgi:MFS family permease
MGWQPPATGDLVADAPFGRYWLAATISSFGTAVTTVALPVLVIQELHASALSVGVVNAAQFVPYAVLGLVAGVYADRWRRQRILVWSSVGRAVTLGALPVLWALDALRVWTLVVLLLAFGAFSVFAFAATQSLLPRLVRRERLVAANARLDQSDAAAQTLGPALGGGLVGLLGAPVAIAVDAVSYLFDAVLNAGLQVDEPPTDVEDRHLGREVREGLSWTYRHPTLAPLAISTHVWFVAHAAGFTALAVVALRVLGVSALVFGLLVAAGGLAGLVGATAAPAVGRRLGTGPTIVATRSVHPLGWLLVAAAPTVPAGRRERQRHGLLAGRHPRPVARPRERHETIGEPLGRRPRRRPRRDGTDRARRAADPARRGRPVRGVRGGRRRLPAAGGARRLTDGHRPG